ncbi:helix-turn-helix domain-containing protein [Frankia sp. AgB32]|uniref:helix-turn-helix domain-containing protein n=1 Tax=Frankia sp. AgB32 TaxID=631119 RepID=UPI0024B21960|nr:helix-turn-helix domain-containing protein [Frankia sp. AgB32]
MPNLNVRDLGVFIRDQRRTAKISLRQLASQAGVSNPYLSQIERGLRRPSAEILQQIAKALRISAEVLYVQAGILEERPGDESVMSAILADESLSERQKQVVLDIYEAFCRENSATAEPATSELPADGTPRATETSAADRSAGPSPDTATAASAAPGVSSSAPARARRSATSSSGSTSRTRGATATGRSAGAGATAGTSATGSTRRRAATGAKDTEPATPQAPKRRATKRSASATPASTTPADKAPASAPDVPDPAGTAPAAPGATDQS